MRELFIEWMVSSNGNENEIVRIQIEHPRDQDLVCTADREREESIRDFAERVFALAQNDAEAIAEGDQLYILRIFRAKSPGTSEERRPLRVLHGFVDHAAHSLSSLNVDVEKTKAFQDAVGREVSRRLLGMERKAKSAAAAADVSYEKARESEEIDEEARGVLRDLEAQLAKISAPVSVPVSVPVSLPVSIPEPLS